MKKYTVVLHPSDVNIEEVKQMKELLAEKIGWYNSKNSLAQISWLIIKYTFIVF